MVPQQTAMTKRNVYLFAAFIICIIGAVSAYRMRRRFLDDKFNRVMASEPFGSKDYVRFNENSVLAGILQKKWGKCSYSVEYSNRPISDQSVIIDFFLENDPITIKIPMGVWISQEFLATPDLSILKDKATIFYRRDIKTLDSTGRTVTSHEVLNVDREKLWGWQK